MLKTICQIVFICCIPMLSGKENTGQEYVSYIENCIEVEDFKRRSLPTEMRITDTETLMEVQKELELSPDEYFSIRLANDDLDTSVLIEELANCWQQYRRKNHYAVSVTYEGAEEKAKKVMTPLFSLMEEECVAKVEKELAKKEGFPEYIRLERVSGLDVYTVCVNMPGEYIREREYIVVLNGVWERQEVCWQTVTFPSTGGSPPHSSHFYRYFTTSVDINYDGCSDLLIYETSSSGTGGSCANYRGIIWKEDLGKFVWYESFPSYVSYTQFFKQRMIHSYRLGISEEHVVEYKVVDGEYTETRELAWIDETLYYYEMGVLVREYDTTDMDYDERVGLYSDLDFWSKG